MGNELSARKGPTSVGRSAASTPLRARSAVSTASPLRARSAVPTASPLRARNPTPRRLGAARVWTFVRIDNIFIQPDLTGHKLEPVRSFRVPECCGTRVRCSKIAIIAMFCKEALCRESKEESPERPQSGFHIWLFGAVWGGRSAASTFQPQRTPRGVITKKQFISKGTPTQRGASFRIADSVPRLPSGSP